MRLRHQKQCRFVAVSPLWNMSDVRKKKFDEKLFREIFSETKRGKAATRKEIEDFVREVKTNEDWQKRFAEGMKVDKRHVNQQRVEEWYSTTKRKMEVAEEEGSEGFTTVQKGKGKKATGASSSYAEKVKSGHLTVLAAGGAHQGPLRGTETNWSSLEPAQQNKLVFANDGEEAPKLDLEESPCTASGYAFVHKDYLERVLDKYAVAGRPVAFAIQTFEKLATEQKATIDSQLSAYKDREEAYVCPTTQIVKLILQDAKTKKTNHKIHWIVMVNMNDTQKILPVHDQMVQQLPEHIKPDCMPNISFDKPTVTSMTVSIVQPICDELGLSNWWAKMKKLEIRELQKEFVKLVSKKDWAPQPPFIPKSRFLKWRGQELEEGRIKGLFKVPNQHVGDLLAISGKHGVIVDFDKRDSEEEEETHNLVKVRMPIEKSITDILKSIEELPQQLKKTAKGILPNYKGYVLRVQRKEEEAMTRKLNPREAEAMGPALGLKTTSAWVVKGIPNFATKSDIVTRFAAASGNGWPGWTVRPRKTLGTTSTKGGTTTWLLDAGSEPPLRAITLNRAIITIEMYHERTRETKKATSFSIKTQKRNLELNPGQMYEESSPYTTIEREQPKKDTEVDRTEMEVDSNPKQEQPTGTDPVQEEKTPASKRRLDEAKTSEEKIASQSFEKMFDFMKKEAERAAEESAKKDKIIESLNATIQGLQGEIKELREMIFKTQTDPTGQS